MPLSSCVTWDKLLQVSRQGDLICKIRLVTVLKGWGEGNKDVLFFLQTASSFIFLTILPPRQPFLIKYIKFQGY